MNAVCSLINACGFRLWEQNLSWLSLIQLRGVNIRLDQVRLSAGPNNFQILNNEFASFQWNFSLGLFVCVQLYVQLVSFVSLIIELLWPVHLVVAPKIFSGFIGHLPSKVWSPLLMQWNAGHRLCRCSHCTLLRWILVSVLNNCLLQCPPSLSIQETLCW